MTSAGRVPGAGLPGGVRVRSDPSVGIALGRVAVGTVVGALLWAAGACSAAGGGTTASCASEITIAGVTYIAGRGGEGATPVPHSGAVLHGTTPRCADSSGSGSTVPAIAYAIPGVRVADAVADPSSNEVMLAERLWQRPWASLPPELQPYVRP